MKPVARHDEGDDDEFFSAELLALEESKLQALGPAEPLPRQQVDALVARATKPAKCPRRRLLLLAGVLALALSPLGWIGARIVWPERRLAPLTMTYAEAVEVATNPDYNASGHESAVGVVASAIAYAARALQAVSMADEDEAIRTTAQAVRAEVRDAVTEAPLREPRKFEGDIVAIVATVTNRALPSESRLAAMRELSQMMHSGAMAMRAARDHVLEPGVSAGKASTMLDRLARELAPTTRSER